MQAKYVTETTCVSRRDFLTGFCWISPRDELTDMACIEVSASSASIYDTDVEQFVKGTTNAKYAIR